MEQDYKYTIIPIWVNYDYYAKDLARHMRKQDVEELQALGITDIEEEIRLSVKNSKECYAAVDGEGHVIVMYGIVEKEPGGMVWCLGTDLFLKYRKSFVKGCISVFARWRKKYHVLWNMVSKENTASIRWLRMFGTKFYKGYMVGGNEFWRFEIGGEKKCVV